MLPEDQKRILGYFIEEAKDHLNTIEQGLLNLGSTVDDPEMMNEVFRAAHSVKGGAAMLGLNSIQRTAHRMEDFFKVMKESRLQPDRDLESTLLQIFDGLQEQLEHLQSPFGLTDDQAQGIMAQLEPVFAQVETHIDQLVAAAPAPPVAPAPAQPVQATAFVHPETSALQLVFRSDIPALLRDMLAAFKRPDDALSRQELRRLCQRLTSLGEQFELDCWCALTRTVEQAIANLDQTYRTLAPVVIKDLKQAQEQVLAGTFDQVGASPSLLELVPSVGVDLLLESNDSALDALLAEALSETEEASALADLFAAPEAGDGAEVALEDSWLEELSLAEMGVTADSAAGAETGLEAVFGEIDKPPAAMGSSGGPAVGDMELNSLADLFEGDLGSLADMWVDGDLGDGSRSDLGLGDGDGAPDFDAEFADLLTEEISRGEAGQDELDDLGSLFDYDLDSGLPTALEPAALEPLVETAPPSASASSEMDELAEFLINLPAATSGDGDALFLGDDFFSVETPAAPQPNGGREIEGFFDAGFDRADEGPTDDDDAHTLPGLDLEVSEGGDPFGDLPLLETTPAPPSAGETGSLEATAPALEIEADPFGLDDLPWQVGDKATGSPLNWVADGDVLDAPVADGGAAGLDDWATADLRSLDVPEDSPLTSELPAPAQGEQLLGEEDFEDFEALPGQDFAPAPGNSGFAGSGVVAIAPDADAPATQPLADGGEDGFDDLEKLLEAADQLGGSSPNLGGRRVATPAARRSPRRAGGAVDQTMRVSVGHLDNLSNLVGELVVNRNSLEQDQERLRQFLDNLLNQVSQLNDVGQRIRDLYERSLLESSLMANRQVFALRGTDREGSSHATGATFDALEMDRFTGFHTLSQEMIELIVRVREASSDIEFTIDSTDQIARQFRQVTTQLQEGLNKARMVAFGQTADRLPRAVRDISLQCGKEAQLVVEGRETLIDKMILERLYDPMTHLVNNAITHGIESPEERLATGKPRQGTITVRAFYQGNQTVIYIADDGSGINPAVVKAKALKQGIITPAEVQTMTDVEVYDLLFLPGFSTRDQADDFSGRGVGMDVVRTALADIRGSITIESEVGKGTSFTVRLPLTLSITKALSCVNNQARIAFPMDGVEDMFDVPKDRIQTNDQGHSCILWRDTLLPFRPLGDLLHFNRSLARGRVYGGPQDEDMISIVVLRSASAFIALQVDQVIGEQEIVIKQLEGPVPKPMGVAGATVLGDGRVMPIADVLELIDLASGRMRRDSATSLWTQRGEEPPTEVVTHNDPTVLIVDDSITVRELLSMSFNKVGYRVEQARDGQEAWEKLRSGLPCDLVFCDIEMPRMDGLELLSRIQKDSSLNHLPIAMLTSRGADRHRQMAVDLGAKGYFTKPYLEEMLLDAAQRMLKGENMVAPRSEAN